MNGEKTYKYDVAISFLQQDESLARELNNLLRDRLATFVYYEQQKKLVGTDGEVTLNRVFGTEARIVVVLYRDEWGKTPWTRIEDTAIRNRGYDEGYDFLTMIPLDKPPTVPKWLPRARIWGNFERWGVEGAAAVIEARVQAAGGTPKIESPEEQASRLMQIRQNKEKCDEFLNSESGVRRAEQELDSLFANIERIISNIHGDERSINLSCKRVNHQSLDIYSIGYKVNISWSLQFNKSLTYSCLYINFHKSNRSPQTRHGESTIIQKDEFNFDLHLPDRYEWKHAGDDRFYSSELLATYCVKQLLDRLEKEAS